MRRVTARAKIGALAITGASLFTGCCFASEPTGDGVAPVPSRAGYGGVRLFVSDTTGSAIGSAVLDVHAVILDEDVYDSIALSGDLADYALADRRPGRYRVSLRSGVRGGTTERDAPSFVVEAGETVAVRVVMHGGAAIRGRTVDAITGLPIAGILVAANAGFHDGRSDPAPFTRSDADGRFELSGVCGVETTSVAASEPVLASNREGAIHLARHVALEIPADCGAVTEIDVGDVRMELPAHELVEIDSTCTITSIASGAPAARIGLGVGDRVVAVRGRAYHGVGDELVSTCPEDAHAALVVLDIRDEPIAIRVIGPDGTTQREIRSVLRAP